MNLPQHIASVGLGFVTTAQVVSDQVPELPKSKGEFIALASAVLVQTLIYGVSKFFKWISAKNDKPQTPSAPLAPQA
ncbi:hypothetical protein CA265_09430 [Sphingobacteriaceae bacterium GW460-11-11-14-LB5]|nr:hypothetical protein CA265_09430 [Sphingobacteriaceae bacterium GW460-11-11-14-LB5]